ncbi:MAG TPA: M56 family metallopeptidase [Sphingomonas sp.]|nr:M56 family metallopeptidase [Sphingomonas sp.]
MSAGPLIAWGAEALIASTLLMLLVLALRGPVRRQFGSQVAYALWALPVLRLLLPPLPADWREAAAAPIAQASETITVFVVEPLGLAPAAQAHDPLPLGLIVLALWALGAAGFFVWHLVAHARFCRRMLAGRVREEMSADGIRVVETDAATGPLAFGVLRKYVAFPRDFAERYDEDERDLAMAHELGHHARGDLIANWAALFVLAVHWFNPVAWRAFRAFRADQEMANDARVLAGKSATFRHVYACAIVKAAHGGAVSAACHLHTINDLKGRLKMLSVNKTSRKRLASGIAAVALVTVTGLGVTASGTQAAETIRTRVSKTIGVELPNSGAVWTIAPAAAATAATLPTTSGQDVPLPPPPPETVPVPPSAAPAAPVAVPAPPAPPATWSWTSADQDAIAGNVHTMKRVQVIKDGKVVTDNIMADMPEVSSRNCTITDKKDELVINDNSGARPKIIICTDRIEKVTAEASKLAANAAATSIDTDAIERNAYRSALSGLRAARMRVQSDAKLSAEDRSEALSGIDESIRDIEQDLANVGTDD